MYEISRKYSPAMKQHISTLSIEENPQIRVMIRVKNSLVPEHKSQLETIGAEVRTIAGDVVTIVLPLRSLPDMASLEFVSYIELSGPLFSEGETPISS